MLQAEIRALVEYLASPTVASELVGRNGQATTWHQWQITPIEGGRNGRVYRATTEQADLAVKLTARDQHNRAGREYAALQALALASLACPDGAEIAPRPLLLERDRYPNQVVVMTWLEGTVADDLPVTDDDWCRLIEHLVAVQTVTPLTTSIQISEGVLSMRSPAEGVERVRQQIDAIPGPDRPPTLQRLLERFEDHDFPSWPPPPSALRRGDPNIRNIVRRPGPWASVDWEYSGWSDPAFEIADLIAHAAYLDVPAERWDWVVRHYARLATDPSASERIPIYVTLMYGFWAGRLGKMLYEVPRGLDTRPAPWPDGWLDEIRPRYEQYLERALRALSQ